MNWPARRVGGVIDFRLPGEPLPSSELLDARIRAYYRQLGIPRSKL